MDNVLDTATIYFGSPAEYFWQWAEEGTIVEWRNSKTIGYTEDILNLLVDLAADGVPAFGAVLLVCAACRDDWKRSNLVTSRTLLSVWTKVEKDDQNELRQMLNDAMGLLDRISELSPHLRTGGNRNLLLRTIFETDGHKMSNKLAQDVIFLLKRGDVKFETASHPEAAVYLRWDLTTLSRASKEFPTVEMLELKLKTGITELPSPIEIEPVPPTPEDLLQQLAQDDATAGLANLTHHIIAALHIPLHTHGSSDQSFGGVSDITNRGNFDRLLLSELAHDDLSLMARLANNEALYLRREELPSNPEKRKVLLIDTTLKLWGLPRVFAISAALACIRNNKAKAAVECYALNGKDFHSIDLATKEGVVEALSHLDASLYCDRALNEFMWQWQDQEGDEFFLITDEENLHSLFFQSILTALAQPIDFVITVNRNGHLQFFEYLHHRRKLVSEARFDLDDLLFNIKRQLYLPAALSDRSADFPLYFPASKMKFKSNRIFNINRSHMVAITLDQRVLYWNDRKLGAREIMPFIEPADYCVGVHEQMVYIMVYNVYNAESRKLHRISLASRTVETIELPATIPKFGMVVSDDDKFYIKHSYVYVVNATNGTVTEIKEIDSSLQAILGRWSWKPDFHFIKKFVNCGYTVVTNVSWVYVNNDGELGIDDRYLKLGDSGIFLLPAHNNKDKKIPKNNPEKSVTDMPHERNPHVKCSTFEWNNATQIIADSRGFLLLRTTDHAIPDIIILLVMEMPVACWASDGTTYGAEYFTGIDRPARIHGFDFYKRYIQPFIDRLPQDVTDI